MTCFKRHVDLDRAWELLKQKTTEVDGCLVMKTTGPDGYGNTKLGGVLMASHRASYIINKNDGKPIPSADDDGNRLVVRHLCAKQQRGCVLPDHLELGTHMVNTYEDKIATGTLLRGEDNPGCKITEDLARRIKHSRRDRGDPEFMTQESRAKKFKASRATVIAIDGNVSWAHVPDRFGVVRSNEEKRRKSRERRRLAVKNKFSRQDFVDAGVKVRKNVVESGDDKGGEMPPGDCWIWQLATNPKGYGSASFKGRSILAHVLSIASRLQRLPTKNEMVRHRCNNPACVNPSHLRLGSARDNAVDIQLNGSSRSFKMNPEKVRRVRASFCSNLELAKMFNVSPSVISDIRAFKSWRAVV
jgi:hypothetical protein